jgi:hypothetical protein
MMGPLHDTRKASVHEGVRAAILMPWTTSWTSFSWTLIYNPYCRTAVRAGLLPVLLLSFSKNLMGTSYR